MPNDPPEIARPQELKTYLRQYLPTDRTASPPSSANTSRHISPVTLERPRLDSCSELSSHPSSSSSSGAATPAGYRTPKDLVPGRLKFINDDFEYHIKAKDLVEESEIGRGYFGTVYRMVHKESARLMAVKKVRACSMDERDQKRLLIELDTVMNSHTCPHIIRFYGALFAEGDCWICMELMDISLEKLYKKAIDLGTPLNEELVGHITVCTVCALSFLKDRLKIMHRDVKPSNIVMNIDGAVKLVDFGVSGRLVNSVTASEGGCSPYMAPERLSDMDRKYDVRSDIWSLGITLVEISTGSFPYSDWESPFHQMAEIVDGPAPLLNRNQLPSDFTNSFVRFVNCCLIKEREHRPKYHELKSRSFYKKYRLKIDDKENLSQFGSFVSRIIHGNESDGSPEVVDVASHSL